MSERSDRYLPADEELPFLAEPVRLFGRELDAPTSLLAERFARDYSELRISFSEPEKAQLSAFGMGDAEVQRLQRAILLTPLLIAAEIPADVRQQLKSLSEISSQLRASITAVPEPWNELIEMQFDEEEIDDAFPIERVLAALSRLETSLINAATNATKTGRRNITKDAVIDSVGYVLWSVGFELSSSTKEAPYYVLDLIFQKLGFPTGEATRNALRSFSGNAFRQREQRWRAWETQSLYDRAIAELIERGEV